MMVVMENHNPEEKCLSMALFGSLLDPLKTNFNILLLARGKRP